jgi:hypothetical protein
LDPPKVLFIRGFGAHHQGVRADVHGAPAAAEGEGPVSVGPFGVLHFWACLHLTGAEGRAVLVAEDVEQPAVGHGVEGLPEIGQLPGVPQKEPRRETPRSRAFPAAACRAAAATSTPVPSRARNAAWGRPRSQCDWPG